MILSELHVVAIFKVLKDIYIGNWEAERNWNFRLCRQNSFTLQRQGLKNIKRTLTTYCLGYIVKFLDE